MNTFVDCSDISRHRWTLLVHHNFSRNFRSLCMTGSVAKWRHKRLLPTTSLSVPASSVVHSIRVSRRISAPQINRTHSSTPPTPTQSTASSTEPWGSELWGRARIICWPTTVTQTIAARMRHRTWRLHSRRNHMTPFQTRRISLSHPMTPVRHNSGHRRRHNWNFMTSTGLCLVSFRIILVPVLWP